MSTLSAIKKRLGLSTTLPLGSASGTPSMLTTGSRLHANSHGHSHGAGCGCGHSHDEDEDEE